MLSSSHCIQSHIATKITPKQQQSVCQGLVHSVNRHNTNGGPTHTNLYCGHLCSVQEPPHEASEECPFTLNELHHSSFQPCFYQRGVVSAYTFACNVTPPTGRSKQQKTESKKSYCRGTPILVEHLDSSTKKPLKPKPGLDWPWTKIDQMVPMCRYCSVLRFGSAKPCGSQPSVLRRRSKGSHYFIIHGS